MQCISPFGKMDKLTGESMNFPCGKCYPCLRRRVSGWSFRLVKEGSQCESSFFLTLTYDTANVPISPNRFMSLQKSDFQKFVKRLRKLQKTTSDTKIKYFACGEYGGKTNRPHYHAIIFNVDLQHLVGKKTAQQIKFGNIPLDGKIQLNSLVWHHGQITIGQVSEASIGYCLKYMMKKKLIPQHKNDDRKPEFQLMSKGLGAVYLSPTMRFWHHADLKNRFYCALPEGKKIAMPRYYKLKLYSDLERRQIGNHLSTTVEKQELTAQQEINRFEHYQIKQKNSRLNENL